MIMSESKQQKYGQNNIVKSFIICTLHKVVRSRRMTWMGDVTSVEEWHIKIKGRAPLKYIGVNWRIMLIWILRKYKF
jgi:hypothetical protein